MYFDGFAPISPNLSERWAPQSDDPVKKWPIFQYLFVLGASPSSQPSTISTRLSGDKTNPKDQTDRLFFQAPTFEDGIPARRVYKWFPKTLLWQPWCPPLKAPQGRVVGHALNRWHFEKAAPPSNAGGNTLAIYPFCSICNPCSSQFAD